MDKIIAVFHPGDMGAAVGACLRARGFRAVWTSAGRSAATRARANQAELEDMRSVEQALQAAHVVLSVCPPHSALDVAREVASFGFKGLYVDANAVSAATARELGCIVEAAGACFIDGGIVGPPPRAGVASRLYLAGPHAEDIATMFADTPMQAVVLQGPIGSASALKVCYAAWTKGAGALLAAIRTLARHEGVEAALLAEWELSQPELPKRSEAISANARKAWRWIAEMEEIASSFAAADLPPGFHLAAAEVYRRLEAFKDESTPPSLAEVASALLASSAPPSARS